MPNSKTGSSIAPKISLSENPEEDFNFYLRFVMPLVPKLTDFKEQKLAGEWVQKLVEDKSNPERRTEYLLLLLFALQRRQLSGPFLKSPRKSEALQPFEDDLNMFSMMERMATQRRNVPATSPYYSEISGDFKEYAVTQEIPNHGIHCYLATSNEPIEKWKNSHLAHIPKESPRAERHWRSSQSVPGCTEPGTPASDLDGEDDEKNFSVALRTLRRQQSTSFYTSMKVEDVAESSVKAHTVGPDREAAQRVGPAMKTAHAAGPAKGSYEVLPRVELKRPSGAEQGGPAAAQPQLVYTAQIGDSANVPNSSVAGVDAYRYVTREGSRDSVQRTQAREREISKAKRKSAFRISLDSITSASLERLMAEFEERLRSSMGSITSASLERLMAEFEEKLRSATPSDNVSQEEHITPAAPPPPPNKPDLSTRARNRPPRISGPTPARRYY